MEDLTHYPVVLSALTFVAMWLALIAGTWLRDHRARAGHKRSDDADLIVGAMLTLLALIVGFTFSMAADRYEQRKTFEEAEANAIGTEFLRADLMPVADAANVRKLLVAYLNERIVFYSADELTQQAQINQRTGQLQAALWAAVRGPAEVQPTPVAALVVAGMNDVINSQGYTQAAMWNWIPIAAWILMSAIALCCNVLLGYGSRSTGFRGGMPHFLPLVVAASFLLIADIDAPRHGLIRVSPQNLEDLAHSIGP